MSLTISARQREPYKVNLARTKQYQLSAEPYIQRPLNTNALKGKEQEEEARTGTGREGTVGRWGSKEGREY